MNPPGYVDVQFQVNNSHMDGRQEAEFEEAISHVATFAKWLRHKEVPVESFLDAGCRTGYGMEALARHFPAAQVTGVDIVPQFIKVASLRGEAVVGDLQALPFENDEFDWTFSCTSIEHCPDLKAAVSEMQRVSKYGFYVHTDLENEAAFNKNPSHFSYHENPSDWVTDFNAPGWWLTYLNVPRFNRVEMIWVKREHVRKYLIKDAPC
jgi:ubiquinone/menaquinone biosynthesis C-methylase UbiE